jgi:hypothetical protein
MKKKIIHVNQQTIRQNIKKRRPDPVVTVRVGSKTEYGYEVEIRGSSRVIYSPHHPLPCGARLWIETESDVVIDGKRTV